MITILNLIMKNIYRNNSPIVFRLKNKFLWRKRKSAKFAAILFIYVYIKAVCIPTPFVNAIVRFCICLWQI